MKLVNNNISPLPFYDDISQQNHRKDYAFGQVYPLITYKNMLLPFQVVIDEFDIKRGAIHKVYLHNFNTGEVIDIAGSMIENGLSVVWHAGFSIIKYPGTLPISEIVHEGQYYLEIPVVFQGSTGIPRIETIYSDIFTVTNRVDDYLYLEYSNTYNFSLKNGIVDFSDNFKFYCYLNTQVGKPEYTFEEEATERMGYAFIESQVSKKIYKFTFLAPEYLCDALRLVRLCENKRVVSKKQEYDLTTFSMDVDWQEQGDLAAVECEFETDTVVANIGGYEPVPLGGNFNIDYNEDYNIE